MSSPIDTEADRLHAQAIEQQWDELLALLPKGPGRMRELVQGLRFDTNADAFRAFREVYRDRLATGAVMSAADARRAAGRSQT